MSQDHDSDQRFWEVAESVAWRIWGAAHSPVKGLGTNRVKPKSISHQLIEDIVPKECRSRNITDSDSMVTRMRDWLEKDRGNWVVKDDFREQVAELILTGARSYLGQKDAAFWAAARAAAQFEPDETARQIHRLWNKQQIDVCVAYGIAALSRFCGRENIFESSRFPAPLGPDDRITYAERRDLGDYQRSLGYAPWGTSEIQIHHPLLSAIALIVDLGVEHVNKVAACTDLRPLLPFTTYYATYRCKDKKRTHLGWITGDAPDDLLGYAIAYVLDDVTRDLPYPYKTSQDGSLEPATKLLEELFNRLRDLDPVDCARWTFEILNHPISALNLHSHPSIPLVEKQDELCKDLLRHLVTNAWSPELRTAFSQGLLNRARRPRVDLLSAIAWDIRQDCPERAKSIAHIVLDAHELKIEAMSKNRTGIGYHTSIDLNSRADKVWLTGLAYAAVIAEVVDEPVQWVRHKCSALPLSVWDVDNEGLYDQFHWATSVAEFRLLTALVAVQLLETDSYTVRSLTELVWSHCHYVRQHQLDEKADNADIVDFAAWVAVEYGNADETWVLKQASNPDVGPRALASLISSLQRKSADISEATRVAIKNAASRQFGDARWWNYEDLLVWAQLWPKLEATDQAVQTAKALLQSRIGQSRHDHPRARQQKITALRLLTFAASTGTVIDIDEDEVSTIYSSLWGSYTPPEEKQVRSEIDRMLSDAPISKT